MKKNVLSLSIATALVQIAEFSRQHVTVRPTGTMQLVTYHELMDRPYAICGYLEHLRNHRVQHGMALPVKAARRGSAEDCFDFTFFLDPERSWHDE